jgi:hypothetical protein
VATSVRVPGFLPSVNGLHFINAFPHGPVIQVGVPPFGNISFGDAHGGLCGGMAFTVRDVFQTPGMTPIADLGPPGADTPLFKYMAGRLVDSYSIPQAGFLKYYAWMTAPDGDTRRLFVFTQHGLAWRTIVEEWAPRIRPRLDSGSLCCLGLVTVASIDPADMGLCHQVLAYGYDLDDADRLTLFICDPNTAVAAADDVRISLSLSDPTQATAIAHNVAIAEPIRGFFSVDYTYHDPGSLEPPGG